MKIKIRRSKLDAVYYFGFIYLGILVDNIVGNQMRITGEDSLISKIYRLVFFGFLLYIMMKRHLIKNEKYFFVLILAVLLPFIQAIYGFSSEGLVTNELYVIKLLFPIYLIWVGYILKNDGIIELDDINKCLNIMCWAFPVSILIPYVLGLGYRTYFDSGYSGFYSAGNEISIVLSMLFILSLDKMLKNFSIVNVTEVVISMIVNVLVGTKTNYILIFLALIYVFMRQHFGKKKIISFLGILIVVLILFVMIKGLLFQELLATIQRLYFRFLQLDQNIWNFLFSNRNLKIIPNLKKSFELPWTIVWGRGYYEHILMGVGNESQHLGLIEMDFFDLFFCYGIFCTFFVSLFYIGNLIKFRTKENKIYCFGILCVLMYSALAGHTLFSALPGTVLAMFYLRISFDKE